jgi:hypothetical protein
MTTTYLSLCLSLSLSLSLSISLSLSNCHPADPLNRAANCAYINMECVHLVRQEMIKKGVQSVSDDAVQIVSIGSEQIDLQHFS